MRKKEYQLIHQYLHCKIILKLKRKLRSEYLQQMTRTAYDISNTGITGEYGQFNSSVNDFKIGIS
jgi:cobalt-zinc-cadmium resistance protein CzcA